MFSPEQCLKLAPELPGIYQMFDKDGQILYVGKAKNLKKRLSSYFRKTGLSSKTVALVELIDDVKVTVTKTEVEALLLESNLIKKHHPRFNILLRDDKSYPYIFLSEHAYPRLEFYRGPRNKPGKYFGPYPNSHAVYNTIHNLQKIFKLRSCSDSYFQNRARPCLQYQIKRCTAPCVNNITPEDYAKDVRHVLMFLEGKNDSMIQEMVGEMEKAASNLQFELAAAWRDQIQQLREIQKKQSISLEKTDADVFAVFKDAEQTAIAMLVVRQGQVLGSRVFFPKVPDILEEEELWISFITQFYLQRQDDLPSTIVINYSMQEKKLLEAALEKLYSKTIKIITSPQQEKRQWWQMALLNAEQALTKRIGKNERYSLQITNLENLLGLNKPLNRFECYDISHTQGEETVASCVVFDRQGPTKSAYRRFNINDITPGDDYAAMAQVLMRRFQRLKKEEAVMPDIVFIDGGKGQLNQALKISRELGLEGVLFIGVSKGEGRKAGLETLWLEEGSVALPLELESPAGQLILQLRDEAHRFAITGHRGRREKKRLTSSLEGLEGIGPIKRKVLLQHFGGLKGLTGASIEDIAKIPGIGLRLAEKIYYFLHTS